jgi:hypothetical protein
VLRHVTLSAAYGVAIDRPPDCRTRGAAEQRAEQTRIARRDDVAEHAAGKAADDQPGRPVAAAAMILAVLAAGDPIA